MLEAMLATASRLSRSRYALGRTCTRGLTSRANPNAATSAPIVIIWATGRGIGMIRSTLV